MIDTDGVAANRDQIWAEAVHLYWEMRETYAKDQLPLFLHDPRSITMAHTLQEGAREESSEEGTGAQIAAWLGTPRPLSHVLGTEAPEDFTNTEGEPLAGPLGGYAGIAGGHRPEHIFLVPGELAPLQQKEVGAFPDNVSKRRGNVGWSTDFTVAHRSKHLRARSGSLNNYSTSCVALNTG